MRYVLAVVLALSTLACADTVDFAGAGSLADHNAGTTGSLHPGQRYGLFDTLMEIFDLTTGHTQRGDDLGKITIDTGRLHGCPGHELCATTGILDIVSTSGKVLFDGSLSDISIRQSGGNVFFSADAAGGGVVTVINSMGDFSTNATVRTTLATVPEPGTLLLLGSGLIGLNLFRKLLH